MSVQQVSPVTPGHVAVFAANGVIQDGGTLLAAQRVLASLKGANFNTTNDQPIVIPQQVIAFQLNSIVITNPSISMSTAVGGFYPTASKGGTPIVAASQTYASLTTVGTSLMAATLAAFGTGTRFSSANLLSIGGLLAIWFSLTTPQGGVASADIYIIGTDLS